MAQKTFTLHLAKDDVATFTDVLSSAAKEKLGAAGTHAIAEPGFGQGAMLYVFVGPENPPRWLRELRREFAIPARIQTSSACAALVFKATDRMFVATFAHAWMYLNEDNLEGDFGLRAALNALDDSKLKRLERANLADALRGVSVSPFQRQFTSFGLDDALDLVRKIGGSARNDLWADSMTGSKSLKVSGEFALRDLPDLATEALESFQSVRYRATSFQVIDVVTPIVDRRLITALDQLAADSIKAGAANFELGLPSEYDEDGVAFKFSGPRLRGRYPDLVLRNYVEALGDNIDELTPTVLREHKIVAVFEDGAKPDRTWTIRKALIGSLVHDGGQYAANEGEWYRVDDAFKVSIEDGYRNTVREWDIPPMPLRKIYDESGNGRYENEADYNAGRAEALGYLLFDTKMVTIPGVQRSGFEPCDLLDPEGRRFIHVKRNSRRSSTLSHLFKQGSNAAQHFKRFPGAWDDLAAVAQRELGDAGAQRLARARADAAAPWTVEFWIADAPRVGGGYNIPFFSKISLRDETSSLIAMGYDVAIRFIGLEPEAV